jgi:AcrR family transcriptional regulator
MARWEPGARERIVLAALDLFTEQGYDDTTVAQIAERAGITKSTFFRHFPDKRELLAAGQETLSRLLAEGIAEAPKDASPLEAVAAGLERVGLAATMTKALVARAVPDPVAHLAAELGVLAFKRGFAAWTENHDGGTNDLAPYTLSALKDLQAASASLG